MGLCCSIWCIVRDFCTTDIWRWSSEPTIICRKYLSRYIHISNNSQLVEFKGTNTSISLVLVLISGSINIKNLYIANRSYLCRQLIFSCIYLYLSMPIFGLVAIGIGISIGIGYQFCTCYQIYQKIKWYQLSYRFLPIFNNAVHPIVVLCIDCIDSWEDSSDHTCNRIDLYCYNVSRTIIAIHPFYLHMHVHNIVDWHRNLWFAKTVSKLLVLLPRGYVM